MSWEREPCLVLKGLLIHSLHWKIRKKIATTSGVVMAILSLLLGDGGGVSGVLWTLLMLLVVFETLECYFFLVYFLKFLTLTLLHFSSQLFRSIYYGNHFWIRQSPIVFLVFNVYCAMHNFLLVECPLINNENVHFMRSMLLTRAERI